MTNPPIKLSHSAMNTFLECGRKYDLRYNKRLVSRTKSSALYFGTAIDAALEFMCKHKDEENILERSIVKFYRAWIRQKNNNDEMFFLKHSRDVLYSKADFDYELLNAKDKALLSNYSDDIAADRELVFENKKLVGWANLPDEQKEFLNVLNWLCLRHKGVVLLKGFYEEILPYIIKVHSTQMYVELKNDEDDAVRGYIDLVCDWRYEDGTIETFVMDFKTSSVKYEDNSVEESEQLALYSLALDEYSQDPGQKWTIQPKKQGFIVLKKDLHKDITKTCKSCGFIAEKNATHRSCTSIIDKKRCGGVWSRSVEYSGNYQVIIDEISEELKDLVMRKINKINEEIKVGEFPMNTEACYNKFGRCEYFDYCHNKGNMNELIQKKEGTRK